jgi:hypothetical protein
MEADTVAEALEATPEDFGSPPPSEEANGESTVDHGDDDAGDDEAGGDDGGEVSDDEEE